MHMSPMFLDILFSIYFMCFFRDKLSSNRTRRNLIVLACVDITIAYFQVGRGEEMLYFCLIDETLKTCFLLHSLTASLLRTILWSRSICHWLSMKLYSTLHLIYFFAVSAHSIIFIYFFLPFKWLLNQAWLVVLTL